MSCSFTPRTFRWYQWNCKQFVCSGTQSKVKRLFIACVFFYSFTIVTIGKGSKTERELRRLFSCVMKYCIRPMANEKCAHIVSQQWLQFCCICDKFTRCWLLSLVVAAMDIGQLAISLIYKCGREGASKAKQSKANNNILKICAIFI